MHALVVEVVGHGQEFDGPLIGQAVADKVHAPDFVDALGHLQRHALRRRPPDFLAPAHGQVSFGVKAIHALVVHAEEPRAQDVVDARL